MAKSGGAKKSGGGSSSGKKKKAAAALVPGQKSLMTFFGGGFGGGGDGSKPKPKSSGTSAPSSAAASSTPKGASKKTAGGTKSSDDIDNNDDRAAAATKAATDPTAPDTPETLPCSPETPAAVRRNGDGDGDGTTTASVKKSSAPSDSIKTNKKKDIDVDESTALEDSDDDDINNNGVNDNKKQVMKTPSTGRKKLGGGGGGGTSTSSSRKATSTSKAKSIGSSTSTKRRIIDSDDDDDSDVAEGKGDADTSEDGNDKIKGDGEDNNKSKDNGTDGQSYVARHIAKKFDGTLYLGTISAYGRTADGDIWNVDYDDGDDEEYDRSELEDALELYDRVGRSMDNRDGGDDKKMMTKTNNKAKRRIDDDSEDDGDDDEDAYKPSNDDVAEEDEDMLVDSDVEFATKPLRKKVKTGNKQKSPVKTSSSLAGNSKKKSGAASSTTTSSSSFFKPVASNKEQKKQPAKRKPDTPPSSGKEAAAAAAEPAAKKSKPAKKSSATASSSSSKSSKASSAAVKPAASAAKPKPNPKPAAKGWGMFKRQTGAEIKAQSKRPKNKTSKAGDADETGTAPIRAYTDGDDLEIISDPQEMFNDMVNTKLTHGGAAVTKLDPLIRTVAGRPLRVATMCSGTESPVLALDMISKSIEDFYLKHRGDELGEELPPTEQILQIEHVFSCEIEPFKQAYIERNFSPPLLFRDIRELGNERACTAYGSLAEVPNTPGTVDVLIAGTSCVDFSNLNNERKKLDESGESGQTFRGMMDWVHKAQPPLVILENVSGAPWKEMIRHMEGLGSLGYYADFARMDTKNYYIPHTRQRGYLLAVKRGPKIDRGLPRRWADMLKNLERNASGALDEFMLPNDDPRVLRGRASLVATGSSSGKSNKTDWTKCEGRHLLARSAEELGDKRPLTGWSESNPTTMPQFAWNDWANAQVHRIHDLLDINTLRLAKQGVDCTFKTMVWDVSQNVDRDTMGKLGLSQCLTPSGINYIPNRGGPLVGEELLLLQGIPADDLLLTRESDKNLKDLAGNAMSTTVVGACILSALVLGHRALANEEDNIKSVGEIVNSLVPRALSVSSNDVSTSRDFGDYQESTLSLEPVSTNDTLLESILARASSSSRKCIAEGANQILPSSDLLVCQECGHTCGTDLATPARKYEEHDFVSYSDGEKAERVSPAEFRKELLDMLPMRISFSNLQIEEEAPDDVDDKRLWQSFTKAFNDAIAGDADYRFRKLIRSQTWTVRYAASNESTLELRLLDHEAIWYLFVKPPPKQGKLRDALCLPVARMVVNNGTDKPFSFLRGEWEVCLPVNAEVEVTIEGVGSRVESWESKLGLKGKFASLERYEKLKMSLDEAAPSSLKTAIEGTYKLLPLCGTACGSLHKRITDPEEVSTKNGCKGDMYYFLESGRCSLPKDDMFVFSPSMHRTSYGEYRPIELQMDRSYRPRAVADKDVEEKEGKMREITGIIPGKWSKKDSVVAVAVSATSVLSAPSSQLSVPLSANAWRNCPEVLSVSVPMHSTDGLVEQCQVALSYVSSAQEQQWIDVNLNKSKKVFDALAFVTARLSIPSDTMEWTALETSQSPTDERDGDYLVCRKCSPPKPSIRWTVVTSGSKKKYVPTEDGREAAAYERAMKQRPHAFQTQLRLASPNVATSTDSGNAVVDLRIGVNAVALAQGALGLFPRESFARKVMLHVSSQGTNNAAACSDCIFEWRIQPHVDHISQSSADFPKLSLTSNKKDKVASQPPNFTKYPLRPEQLRSLAWMLAQEATDAPFYEEEVTEGILSRLGWRAEGRVRRPVMVRGGIIADEVGYGKTAITLGLIDAATEVNGEPEGPPVEFKDSLFETKATLIIIPTHLMGQWPNEIRKFLGDSKVIITIKDMNSFNKITVQDIQEADIVLVNFTVLSNEKYFERLARLAGVNGRSLPSGKGKDGDGQFNAVYGSCISKLQGRVKQLKEDASTVYGDIETDADLCMKEEENAEAGVRLDGKKAVYSNVSEEQTKAQGGFTTNTTLKKKGGSTKAKDLDPWDLSTSQVKRNAGKMKCPPLEIFHWNRLVVDEFSYLVEKMNRQRVFTLMLGLRSSNRWCLSGTPPHANFNDVQSLALLLGIYLGKDEPLPGEALTKKKNEGKTSLEAFSALLEVKSTQWHERRHNVAQSFLDRFVRQNVAEIDEIKWEEKSLVVDMPPAEKAIYLEMESYLRSLEMNAKGAMKSKKKSRGDRELRMQDLLSSADSGQEALLKRCAHFDLSSSDSLGEALSALDTCTRIAELRKKELDDTLKHLKDNIVSALRQRILICEECPGWEGTERSEKGEVEDRLAVYIEDVLEKRSVSGGADVEIHEQILSVLREAQKEVEANPTAETTPTIYAEANSEFYPADGDKEPERKPRKQMQFDRKYALREHIHDIRALGKELCGRSRSLRYFAWVRDFQQRKTVVCKARSALCTCNNEDGSVRREDSGVLSSCGHVGCLKCLQYHAGKDECVDRSCQAPVKASNVISARDLGAEQEGSEGGGEEGSVYGAKLSAIVNNVKSLVKDGDRVIVFVQFADLKEKVAEALENDNVKTLQVKGTVNQQIKSLNILQKETPDKNDPRVLLLTMDDESSAGVNLTTCNHAVFVHPLLADTQQQYEAYETQAIGRVRRYGQTKTVHIWRYFARDTIDGEVYEDRTGFNVNLLPSN